MIEDHEALARNSIAGHLCLTDSTDVIDVHGRYDCSIDSYDNHVTL